MVHRTPEGYEYNAEQIHVVKNNLDSYGNVRFRAGVIRAIEASVRQQAVQSLRLRIAQRSEAPPVTIIKLSHEMSAEIIDTLRGPADDESKRYVYERDQLRALIDEYDQEETAFRRDRLKGSQPQL